MVVAEALPSGEVAIGDVLTILRDGWWQIAVITLSFVLVAIAYLNIAERHYQSSLVVIPVSGSASLPSGIGGIASLAGINVPGLDTDSQFDMFLEGLTTRETSELMMRTHPDLLPLLFPKEWVAARREWQQPTGPAAGLSRSIKSMLGMETAYRPPDGARLQRWIIKELAISKDRDLKFTVISLETPDPELGRAVLAALHQTGDSILRARAVARADDYAAYLSGKLKEVMIADYREALVEALAEQEKTRMMASSDLPFSADPFGPPSTADKPSKPDPVLALTISVVIGFLLGTLFVVMSSRAKMFSSKFAVG